ncbi:hypothetical protein SAMN05443245_6966 [Paraburkholderia fungorum]|uniref:Uncharacterized protein n=1 Tax=Paraburkholderia fungorum TaxID=134537 RepID=A0A1H1JPG1_9BURK|nr:hypothetical protein [Paraburkholderia fungorum]SDR51579.1 hypothetical protein SAMN05443245_6966 [Paraburkholderia fungorum]
MPTTAFEFRSIRDTRREALTIRDMEKQMRAYADGTIQKAPSILFNHP